MLTGSHPTQIPEFLKAMFWEHRGLNREWGSYRLGSPASSHLPGRVAFSRSVDLLSLSFPTCTVDIRQALPQDPCEELRSWGA